jgi:predicted DNA-binding transcriptional regulator AlpA
MNTYKSLNTSQNQSDQSTYITEREASKITCMSIAWFQRDRWQGGGIPFVKLGRAVRYKLSDVVTYMESRKRWSTSDNTKLGG